MKVSIKEILTAIAIIAILAVAHYFLPYRIASAFSADSADIHIFGLPFILGGLILLSIVAFFVLKANKRPCPQFLKKALVLTPIALVVIVPITYHCVSNEVAFHGSNYGVLYNLPYEGVANQWGKVIVEPNFHFINIAYDNSSNKTVFICCNVNTIENSPDQTAYGYKMFFSIFNESGEVIENREGYLASSGPTVREYLEERYSNIKPLGSTILDYSDGENDYLQIEFLDANIGDTQICDTNASSSTSDNRSSSNSSSSSNNNNSSHSEQPQPRQPERHETPVPIQVWNPCFMCGGTGLCTSCQGKGEDWYGNSYQLCVTCHGNMYCQKCYGRKGYYTTEYR